MMISDADIAALILTLKLAFSTTFILLLVGTPLAWWLAHSHNRCKIIVESIVALPLVLPPTVLGFYLLISLGKNGFIGQMIEWFGGSSPIFSFSGLLIGSLVYSLPFVVQPLRQEFSQIGLRPIEIASTLRSSPLSSFLSLILPMSKGGYITAAVLGFAHTMGEFGVVLMIGGNIPGETRLVSIAIYDHVESLNYSQAHLMSAILLILSFVMMVMLHTYNNRRP